MRKYVHKYWQIAYNMIEYICQYQTTNKMNIEEYYDIAIISIDRMGGK